MPIHRSKATIRLALTLVLLLLASSVSISASPSDAGSKEVTDLGEYIVIGWNDLGMHCSNKDFADLAVLPPFNTVWATLIRRGTESTPPLVVGPSYSVTYRIQGNTYSVGKTDFWSWEDRLFGVSLPDNIGLTGKGLTGAMDWHTDHFVAEGIPLTPFVDSDLIHEQPYQLAWLEARDSQNNLLATTEIVAPVSNEMRCADCHHAGAGETVERAILRLHDEENQTNLVGNRPVLCAGCHGSNALGMPGNPELPSLSLAMHQKHAEYTNDCYKCHPGPNTQCLRDVMSQEYGMTCQSCHGSMSQVAQSIEQGREPWLEEPRCGACHGAAYSEEPNTLYRNSNNGHGGLYCATCHSSPHAILPSREERDNRQNLRLQGYEGSLKRCDVCHGDIPWGPGPHGLYPTGTQDGLPIEKLTARLEANPNPLQDRTEIRYSVVEGSVRLAIHDATGREVKVLTASRQSPGDHTLVWDGTGSDGRPLPAGVYFCRLETGGKTATARIAKLNR